jgi:hypothetical protein
MQDFNEMQSEPEDEIVKLQKMAQEEEKIAQIKDRLARANYESIIKYGIDVETLDQPESIKNIIKETLLYFEELEEYEKCAELKEVLESF